MPWPSVIAILAALMLIAAACGGGDTDEEDAGDDVSTDIAEESEAPEGSAEADPGDPDGSGGVLRIGMTAGNVPFPATPPNEGFEGRRFVGYQIYDALFRYNVEQGDAVPTPEPGLAESYTLSDDQLTWTIKLREDVTFHDGEAFDADAVIFNLDRVTDEEFEFYDADSATSNVNWFAQIESYEKTGDYEVTFTTSAPYSWLPHDLSFIYFASPLAVETYGNEGYLENATGTGPFKMTEYVDGQIMELEAFDDYYRGRPKVDKIELYPMPEAATRLAALQAGDIDWAELPPPDSVAQLESQGFQVLLKEYPHIITYQLNVQKEPFDDVRVRQALNYAMDSEGTSALINDVGYPATQYLYEGHPWYDPSWEGYGYDPEKAKELLAEAGVEDLVLNVAYPTGGSGNMFPGPMNEKLQADLAAIGVEVNLMPMEWNNIITGLRQGLQHPDWTDVDALYISLAPLYPSGMRLYITDFAPETAGFGTASCCNAPGYSNPEVDALYYAAAAEFDVAASDELLMEMQSLMMRDAPVIVTVHDLNLRVLSPDVKGFVQPQSWFADLTQLYVEE